jgi:redox-sensitive bicupin YhaK (pirin superfamily)
MKSGNHGVYVFVIEGSVTIGDITLNKRDGIGIYDVDSVLATVHEQSKILLIEVPMK